MSEMRKVSKDEFYAAIGPMDVEVSTRGNSRDADYGSDFTLQTYPRTLVGRTVAVSEVDERWRAEYEYFLTSDVPAAAPTRSAP